MAVQTIILRPNGQTGVGNAQVITRVPSDTADENLYMLFNEEVADDGATYVSFTAPLAVIGIAFPMDQIADIVPTDIRLVARMKSESVLWKTALRAVYTDSEGNEVTSNWTYLVNENLDAYETLRGTLTDFEVIKSQFATASFQVGFSSTAENTTDKSGTPYLTQLYLEVDYDDEAAGGETVTPALYLKQSGAWEAVTGTVYNKVNGAWVEGDLGGLSAGDKVVVNEVAT